MRVPFTDRHQIANGGEYVCTRYHEQFEDEIVIICPEYRGYVKKRTP